MVHDSPNAVVRPHVGRALAEEKAGSGERAGSWYGCSMDHIHTWKIALYDATAESTGEFATSALRCIECAETTIMRRDDDADDCHDDLAP